MPGLLDAIRRARNVGQPRTMEDYINAEYFSRMDQRFLPPEARKPVPSAVQPIAPQVQPQPMQGVPRVGDQLTGPVEVPQGRPVPLLNRPQNISQLLQQMQDPRYRS
jgi:hypothetical protein